MKRKNLFLLIACALVLGIVYTFVGGGGGSSIIDGSADYLFRDIDSGKIQKVQLQQGKESVELVLQGDTWVLPSRGGYPASATKVRAFFLKLLDLSTSQKLPSSEAGLKKLGLDDDGVATGHAKVSFFDAAGNVLGGLFVGTQRSQGKTDPQQGMFNPSGSGQFVRRLDQTTVYLVGLPLSLSAQVASWLDTALVNFLQSKVNEVRQKHKGEDGTETKVFTLVKKPAGDAANPLTLQGELPEGKELQESVIAQVGSGLENLTIQDVSPVEAEEVRGLQYDAITLFRLDNGLVYSISTAEKDSKIYGRVDVTLDSHYADAMNKKAEAEKAQAEASPSPSVEASPAAEGEDNPTASEKKPEKKHSALVAATLEEANTEDTKHAPWVYHFAPYQGAKFRKSFEDLFKKVEAEAPGHGHAHDPAI